MRLASRNLLGLGVDAVLISGAADGLTLPITVEENITLVLDELTFIVVLPERLESGRVIGVVVFANESLEMLSSFGAVVEGHLGEEVMDDMEVSDIVEEEASLPAENGPVNGSGSATLEVPFLAAVVRHDRVGVMKISDHDEPVGDREPREAVVLDSISSTKAIAGIGNTPDHGSDTDIGHDDCIALGLGEEDRIGIEVVGPFRVSLLTRNVEEKVGRESEDLLTDQHEQGIDGGIAQDFVVVKTWVPFLGKAKVGAGLGDVNLITFHGRVVAVVAVVRDFPAEVRSPKEAVGDEADGVVDPFMVREGTMSTLMTNDPDTGEDEALEPPVGTPGSPAPSLSTDRAEKFSRRLLLEIWVNV